MNIDKFLKIFVPKDHSFFPLFESAANNLVKAARLLKELMTKEEPAEHDRIYKEIKDIEHIGDQITNKTYEQLNKSFITPFDREDIHELTSSIDDVLDSIYGISKRIYMYKPLKFMPSYEKLADLILDASIEIEKAVICLKDPIAHIKEITASCKTINHIEHLADEIYFEGILNLFEKEENPKELLKNNKILEMLERCADEQEDVADTLKTIIIKMA
jgi:predicted phosphate transport protein (TIGR00153 family)